MNGASLRCDLSEAACRRFDVVIVGGGIYGAMLALEAGMRGLTTLLIEQDDFAAHTSANNLRILHGGLRHLQDFDLTRYFESVGERRWYLRHFPDLVRPLPCVMPLRGKGLQRGALFRVALALNDLFSLRRNVGTKAGCHLPGGRVLERREIDELLRDRVSSDWDAAALWYDGLMISPQRMLIEVLRWAAALGVQVANYARAVSLVGDPDDVKGVVVEDRLARRMHEVRCTTLINTTGRNYRDLLGLAKPPSDGPADMTLAWNVGVNRAPFGAVAVGATSPVDHNTYFLVPWRSRLMIGTAHDRLEPGRITPSERQIAEKLGAVRAAFPGFDLRMDDVVHVFSGHLPGRMAGDRVMLDKRPKITIHGRGRGIVTVRGVKFTTARHVADAVLNQVSARPRAFDSAVERRPEIDPDWDVAHAIESGRSVESLIQPMLNRAVDESAFSVEDLVQRRTTLADAAGSEAARLVAALEEQWPHSTPAALPHHREAIAK